MNKISLLLLTFIFFVSCGDNSKIGKYTKEELPSGFNYSVVKDESDKTLEKNQLYVELSQKLTEGQIATVAGKLFNSKDEKRRFYIFYSLKNTTNSDAAWAISHFDPELEIQIMGSTAMEENDLKLNADKIDGEVIGKFYEEEYTSGAYTVFKKDDKVFVKTTFKDGSSMEKEMKVSKSANGKKLELMDGTQNGEYYILTENSLEFYNSEDKKFTVAEKI